METLNKKIIRLRDTIERFRDLYNQVKVYQTPGKRQYLIKSLQAVNKNISHQLSSIRSHISGNFYIITYSEGDKKYRISFMNCTKEEAISLTKAFSYSHDPCILEIQELTAFPDPIKL